MVARFLLHESESFLRWYFYRTGRMIGYAYQIRDGNGGKQMVAQMSKKSKIYHRPGC